MKPNERDNILYLEDIAIAMERIQEYIYQDWSLIRLKGIIKQLMP